MADTHPAVVAMTEAGASPIEVAAFRRRLDQLDDPDAGLMPSAALEPAGDLDALDDLPEPRPDAAREVLDRLVVLKLNGGLGTSMGLDGPKSLIEVKPGRSFLDVIAVQALELRRRFDAALPLLLMNSTSTRRATLERLATHPGLDDQAIELDFLQGREPKLRADDHTPVSWPADPALAWCPPGHGDLYTALAASGTLDRLLDAGIRWCFVSNSDNLGAAPDIRIASWIAEHRIPFLLEVVRGTGMDRKGGHLAVRDGRLVLRETAQVPDGDPSFTDVERWRWYNTNNLWFDLEVMRDLQRHDPAAPALPLIVNRKTVDPTDPDSTPVLQLETAMGAAIGSIEGARALVVPRTRFAPVKTTDDLLVSRSDLYDLADDGRMVPTFDGRPPDVTLDRRYYRMIADFEARFPGGAPSLRRCTELAVDGDVTFDAGVVVEGAVHLTGPRRVAHETLRG